MYYEGNERSILHYYRDLRKQKEISIQENSRKTQLMHIKMKCKFFDFKEYNLQKIARGFKQRNKHKIQCKKDKLFFECKEKIIQSDWHQRRTMLRDNKR